MVKGRATQLQNSSPIYIVAGSARGSHHTHSHKHSSDKEQISRVSLRANNSDRMCHLTPLHFVYFYLLGAHLARRVLLFVYICFLMNSDTSQERGSSMHPIFPRTVLCLFAAEIYIFCARVIFMDWCAEFNWCHLYYRYGQ